MDISKLAAKEWDLDSEKRRFTATTLVFADNKNKVGTYYCLAVEDQHYLAINPSRMAVNLSKNEWKPLYWPTKRRIHITAHGLFCFPVRLFTKQFKQGISTNSHRLFVYSLNDMVRIDKTFFPVGMEYEHMPVDVSFAVENEGPISDHLYLGKESVFFGVKQIGLRYKDRFIVVPELSQEVMDALHGTKCNVEVEENLL